MSLEILAVPEVTARREMDTYQKGTEGCLRRLLTDNSGNLNMKVNYNIELQPIPKLGNCEFILIDKNNGRLGGEQDIFSLKVTSHKILLHYK